jgi:hypothetical protein
MPISYRYDDELERLGTAAFLRIEDDPSGFRGALFVVDARGEPLEFAYNRVEVVKRFLWGAEQLQRHAARRLVTTLFDVCPRVPSLLLCRADEVGPELFSNDVQVAIPVARLADEASVVGQAASEQLEPIVGAGLQAFWSGESPAEDSPERALLGELVRRGLLVEPFDRAAVGLSEVYGDAAVVD